MSARSLLFGMLAVVASAAAVLSFEALDELGALCGFGPLSALLPVVVDAGAAAGSVAWLSRTGGRARVFGRALALLLLVGSVAGNALSHGLTAYALAAPWWVVVAVSAVPPAVLGAVVHLATLTAQGRSERSEVVEAATREGSGGIRTPALGSNQLQPGSIFPEPGRSLLDEGVGSDDTLTSAPRTSGPADDRAAELIAEGVGRRRLAKELGISEYEARALLGDRRNGNGVAR